MIIWQAQEAQEATNGRLLGDSNWQAYSICIDSRIVKKGDLFIALKGTKTDGHDYIREAFIKGAAAVMVERLPQNFPTLSPVLLVENCIEALYRLALYRRQESQAKLVAVTGSVGKTSTKEMLNIALSNFGITHASAGNNNNEIGAPLSLARMPKDSDFGIFELGMNHANEISPLSKLVRPKVSIITTVAEVHIENFPNLGGIAEAKSEIFDGMEKGGTAILPADNEFFEFLCQKAENKGLNIISFGESENATVRLVEHKDKIRESSIKATLNGVPLEYNISARGKHMALNSLAVLGAVFALECDVDEAANSLSNFSATQGRGQILQSQIDGKKYLLIDDSYNASPVSMRAAIGNLGAIEAKGRRVAILGDMLELGEKSEQLHESLIPDLVRNQIDIVFTVGPVSKIICEKIPARSRGGSFASVDEIMPMVASFIKNDDVVLVKSSHGTGLYKLVEYLTKQNTETTTREKENAL